MITKFEDFINEGVTAPKGYWDIIKYDLLTTEQVESIKKKFGLKAGDPLLFTGNRNVFQFLPSMGAPKGASKYLFSSGEEFNNKGCVFVEWTTASEIESLGDLVTGSYTQQNMFGLQPKDSPKDKAAKINSFLIAKCKDSSGHILYLSLHSYNPKYKKSAPKLPDVMDPVQLEAVMEWVAQQLGIEKYNVTSNKGETDPLNFYVNFTTWFIYTRPHAGDDAKVAGPFGKEADAKKEMEKMNSTIKREGDLDQEKLAALKFRVDAKNSPTAYYVTYNKSSMSNKEFTASVKKTYGDDIMTKLKGRVAGKRFGI